MKQVFGDKKCVACVGAMATNSSVEEFEKFVGKKAPFSDIDLYKYLLSKGYLLGYGMENKDEIILNEKMKIQIEWKMEGTPCYILVVSETQKETPHAIYWDGARVFDPNPKTKDGRELCSYKILFVYPISKIGD